jgi:peptidoglycan hydrolase-like amidase
MPYLTAKADPYDGVPTSSVHTWTTTLTAAAIQRKYPSLGTLRRIVITQRDGNGEWYGRVNSLQLDGSRADRTISGDSFRWLLGLRSTWFSIDQTG